MNVSAVNFKGAEGTTKQPTSPVKKGAAIGAGVGAGAITLELGREARAAKKAGTTLFEASFEAAKKMVKNPEDILKPTSKQFKAGLAILALVTTVIGAGIGVAIGAIVKVAKKDEA